ncbi:unnamed protein product [Fusarium venenatum]|uniref:Uncharacterized protein n=1 Tax=Fusarium venenatum TaxID=56646 RepID=A0A2L2T3C7_9HYPO|nr:uncharacterized protein FVRRES_01736 [Fusarium venenatum]CEI65224.1 unnamed protein product [Fusarium venenatum]
MRDIDDGSLMSNLEVCINTILLAASSTSVFHPAGDNLWHWLSYFLSLASLFFIPTSDIIQPRYQQYCFDFHPSSLGNSARLRRDASLNSQAFCLVDSGTYVRAYGAITVLPQLRIRCADLDSQPPLQLYSYTRTETHSAMIVWGTTLKAWTSYSLYDPAPLYENNRLLSIDSKGQYHAIVISTPLTELFRV